MDSIEYDEVTSSNGMNGVTWLYMKDNKVLDTAYMSYKSLYEIQVMKT